MFIGYDAKRITSNKTGLGSYGRTLVNSLSPSLGSSDKMMLYTPCKGDKTLTGQLLQADNISFVYPQGCRPVFMRSLWRVNGIVKDLLRDRIDIFHGLSGELPAGLKTSGIASIVTIHDLIFLCHPEYYNSLDVQIYKWKFRNACRQADRMIAISECTKQDIIRFGDFPAERIDVVYQSCAKLFGDKPSDIAIEKVKNKYALPQRFILNVGTVEERKNILLAVKALPLLPRDIHLVVVGRSTRYAEHVLKYARKHNIAHRLHIFDGVTNDELPAFYHLAECFVYPSRYEGFGLPIIEAVQSGLAVVACTGSCLEEAGGKDNLYVAPDDVSGMANAVSLILDNPEERNNRIERSMQYVSRFENNDIASQMLQVYNTVLNEKNHRR